MFLFQPKKIMTLGTHKLTKKPRAYGTVGSKLPWNRVSGRTKMHRLKMLIELAGPEEAARILRKFKLHL